MRNLSKKLVSLGTCIAICSTAILAGGCSNSKNSSTSNGGKIDMKALEKEEKELKPDYTVKYDGIKKASIDAGVSVHDPSILKVDDTYYIYGSHMSTAKSTDLRNWTSIGDGYIRYIKTCWQMRKRLSIQVERSVLFLLMTTELMYGHLMLYIIRS